MDPTGFEPDIGVVSQPGYPDVPLPDDLVTPGPGFQVARYLNGGPPPAAPVVESSHANEAPSEAAEVGAAAPPTDVDTTGSSSEYVPQPVTTVPEDWAQNPYVQIEGGFLGGLMLGVVPFAGVGQQLLDTAEVLPHGSQQARLGLAIGQIAGGVIATAGGVTGELLGGAASKFGIGINEAANGVFLPNAQHAALHTKEYYEAVNATWHAPKQRKEYRNGRGSFFFAKPGSLS